MPLQKQNITTAYNSVKDDMDDKYLTFLICESEFAIEIRYIREVVGIQNISPVPELPFYIKGIINLRGKIIPVLDVRLRFGKPEKAYDDRTCIIIINIEGNSVGFIVDTVLEVLNIPANNIEPSPNAKAGFSNKYITAVCKTGNTIKLLINCAKVITDDDLKEIEAIASI